MPYDTIPGWKKIYRLLDPAMVVVAKHDVWPAQIWTAKDQGIPVFLINASLGEQSTRSRFVFGRILSMVYRDFTGIMTISEEDQARFKKSFKGLTLNVTGDTKYDQVLLRMEHARHDPPLDKKWRLYSKIFAAGSIWPEDEAHLVPALKRLLTHHDNLKIILVPHEPTKTAIIRLKKQFGRYDPVLFSELENRMPQSRVLLVDQVGQLAGLYDTADIAYVGGSFRQGIHNAMEPAVYGIPVLYGPVHTNSREAIKLLEAGGARMVRDQKEIYSQLELLLNDDKMAGEIGKKAREYALKNTGATEKLITSWAEILEEKR
jgi:3-deoxy-D-manno-octulosonic-acid transferase